MVYICQAASHLHLDLVLRIAAAQQDAVAHSFRATPWTILRCPFFFDFFRSGHAVISSNA